jgi:hypothetical protein
MPVFETGSGSRLELLLPHTKWPELEQVVMEYQVLLQKRKAAGFRVGTVEREREQAIRKDLEALKKALVEGTEDPGPKHEDKAKKESETAKRRYDALDLALEDVEVKLIDVVDAHRDDWLAEVVTSEEEARVGYEEAIEALSVARARLSRQRALKSWLTQFPDQPSYRVGFPYLRKLTAPHGDAYPWEDVVEALRFDANPPQPAPPPAYAQPLRQVT